MSKGFVVGIDLGATNLRAALGDSEHGIVRVVKERMVSEGTSEDLLNQLIGIVKRVASEELSEDIVLYGAIALALKGDHVTVGCCRFFTFSSTPL